MSATANKHVAVGGGESDHQPQKAFKLETIPVMCKDIWTLSNQNRMQIQTEFASMPSTENIKEAIKQDLSKPVVS